MIDAHRLEQLEDQVRAALAGDGQLDVAGYGEISCVLNLKTDSGRFVCKRLPLMPRASFHAYKDVVEAYVLALEVRGIVVAATTVAAVGEDPVSAYCIQPFQERLLVDELRKGAGPWLPRLASAVVLATGKGLGLDGQVSNWAVDGDDLVYFDVTTPLLRDYAGNERLDLNLFLKPLPTAMRPLVRRFLLDEILSHYYDPRAVMLDAAANLHKEHLEHLVRGAIEAFNDHLASPLSGAEVKRYYRSDAVMWEALLKLRRADRWWQRKVRRRDYPFLLPGKVDR